MGSAAAVALAAVAGCSVPAPRRTGPTADPAPGVPITSSGHARLMQLLAHPDDDLYFMNPDAELLVAAGVPLVCVYVTAGEHDGRNKVPGRKDVRVDKAAYASARHQGLRQAYARMLGLDAFAPWKKGVATLRGGHRAEVDTLVHRGRRVELVFLNLPMHAPRRPMALPSLWKDRAGTLRTVVSEGSPLTRSSAYGHDQLIDVLVGLFERYRPTVVHTLDPDPDIQHSDDATRRADSEQPGYSDHADHTAVASFSWAALVRWVAERTRAGDGVPAFAATAFRGYYNRHWPKNLPPAVLARKAARLVPYGGDPAWQCGNPGGCGDYNVGGKRPLTNRKGWVRSTHYRYPGTGPVVTEEPDGRLAAHGVLGLRAVRWRESTPGSGRWGPPDDLGGGPLAPALGGAVTPDGRVLLFGLRFAALAGHGGANRREVVLLEQSFPGGPFRAWRGLGNPERGDDRGRRLGVPVAVASPDGTVHLFVRDAGQGLSTRVRDPRGAWSGWRSLGGSPVQDGLSAVVDAAGRVHVYAAGRETVHHWTQEAPGRPVEYSPGRLPLAGDPVAPVALADGGVELYFRRPAGAALNALRTAGGVPPRAPLDGYGPVRAGRGPTGTALLGRDLRGRLALREGARVAVRERGTPALEPAALHVGRRRTVAVGIGADARPWLWAPGAGARG
ncbi:PIG-L family deacetylase [Streptomyces sp. NPDC001941]|uniref:PIG-L family deacetylase n=1 Tax=Streptomyces sp. NPDC001941 TaxID=3154659 RepID=UPI00332DAC25